MIQNLTLNNLKTITLPPARQSNTTELLGGTKFLLFEVEEVPITAEETLIRE